MQIEGRGVQSVEVGGRILDALVEARQPVMLRDLAVRAKITPAQAHAYLVSFRKLGIVEQDGGTGCYKVGPFALQLGLARLRSFEPLRLAANAITDFAERLQLMATTAVWGTYGPTIVQVHESANQVHVNVKAGAVFAITGTATGRVFAAFLSRRIVGPFLEAEFRQGSQSALVGTPTNYDQLESDLNEVRARGYAVAVGQPIPGINALSAPIFDYASQLQFVVTILGPAGAVNVEPGNPQATEFLTFARGLSAQLGYEAGGVV